MYNGCYESQISLFSSEKGQSFNSEAGTVRTDCHGAICDGGRFFYATKAETRRTSGALSFRFDPRGEPPSVCPQGRGAILAEASLVMAEVPESHGLVGKGESGDREGVKRDRPITV